MLAVVAVAWLAWQQVQVDAEVGAPKGPDRRVASARGLANDAHALTSVARETLAERPIDGGAFRMLGLAAALQSNPDRAGELYRIAARLDPRDDIAQAMLIDASFEQGAVGEGVTHVDALLRIAPHMRESLLASLVPYVANPQLLDALVKALAADPPWRGSLAPVLRHADATQTETLLAALTQAVPLTAPELAARVEALTALGEPGHAREIWLQSLPEADRALDGLLFDAGFEGIDKTDGFGWRWNEEPGVTIAFDAIDPAQGQQSLQVDFSGRAVRFVGPRQRLVLAPGSYEISSAVDDRTGSPRRFAWFVQCNSGPALIELDLPANSDGHWKTVRADFDVPPDCQGQQLTLRHTGRSMAERQISGVLRVDDVQLRKLPNRVTLPNPSHAE
ncbi:tetratricopeptide repeat protein [Lysobacter sp. GCM10012299]|uniref:tetratricopeptide repeat protein n=1 Tax=Lysobacter sp. GCM10012299 TaxID=3317333 RepID=UPI00360BDB22